MRGRIPDFNFSCCTVLITSSDLLSCAYFLCSISFFLPNWWCIVKAVKSIIIALHYRFVKANIFILSLPFSDYLIQIMSFTAWYKCYSHEKQHKTGIQSNIIMIICWITSSPQLFIYMITWLACWEPILRVFETYIDFPKRNFPLLFSLYFNGLSRQWSTKSIFLLIRYQELDAQWT